ncbi:hypothetical protein EA187_00590 [Lujinxingia sediminis]|uniref:Uncharacterized protein n=1 Tax=Lujinxingia sediminis TaxID=2480984 RepID=A0ABY0CWI4_9DELT|nr:hypothetical protein [Lujinxingia sediminis]RVU47965.1 hypothetical protein EA187_00590 [Lujinxingia sediminis]
MPSPTLRIWSEHLPLSELASPPLLRLLARYRIHPIAALRPDADLHLAATYIRRARALDLQPGIWPLLSPEQGYWPNTTTLPLFAPYIRNLIQELLAREAVPALAAIDLEPPLDALKRLHERVLRPFVPAPPPRHAPHLRPTVDLPTARTLLDELIADLHRLTIPTLGITLPTAAHDLRDGHNLWQRIARTPWMHIDWQLAGIMTYGSMLSGYSRGLLSPADARYIHWRLLRHLHTHFGPRAHASIGLTGTGVLGDEPAYSSPTELALDLGATLHAGVHDVAIFCLEGILNDAHPERWFSALTRATPAPPSPSLRTRSLQTLAAATRSILLTTLPR